MAKREDKVLELESRRRIFELISSYPGLHFRELTRRLDMPHSSVSYHLRYLVKRDVIAEVTDGRLARYYVKGEVDRSEKRILSVLRKEIPRGIVLFLMLNPGAGHAEILENFDLAPSQLSYYLKKLMNADVIDQEKEGRSTHYTVRDEEAVAKVLISYQPTFLDSLVDAFVEAWTGKDQ